MDINGARAMRTSAMTYDSFEERRRFAHRNLRE